MILTSSHSSILHSKLDFHKKVAAQTQIINDSDLLAVKSAKWWYEQKTHTDRQISNLCTPD